MAKKIQTVFSNYGRIKDLNIIAEDAQILLISAGNGKGKTTVRTAINEALLGKAIKHHPLTKGEEQGWYEIHLPDKDGNTVIVKHDFNKFDSSGKFVIVDHTGKTYKTRTKLLEILGTKNYNPMDVDDIFGMLRDPEGTRKFISTYILPNINPKILSKINIIDDKLNESKGELFLERRIAKRKLEETKSLLKNQRLLTDQERKKVESIPAATKRIDELREELDLHKEAILHNEKTTAEISNIGSQIDRINELYSGRSDAQSAIIQHTQGEIDRLKQRLKEEEEKLNKATADLKEVKEKHHEELLAKNTLLEEKTKSMMKLSIDPKEITETINTGLKFLEEAKELEIAGKAGDNLKKKMEEEQNAVDTAELNINNARNDRRKLLSMAKLPAGLQYDPDEAKVTMNGLDFTNTEISESEAKMSIAELKCLVEQAPLLDMGVVSVFGPERIQELRKLAKKFNKLIIMEKVVDDDREVFFEAIVEEEPGDKK